MPKYEDFESRVEVNRYAENEEATTHRTRAPYGVAQLSAQFLEKWGMVAGIEDGEDSAGRSKCRLATPQEVVDRACETAALLWAAWEKQGWIAELPVPRPQAEVMAEIEAEKLLRAIEQKRERAGNPA